MENKKIKVYLQYPWKFPDSPYYKYLIKNPPENVGYLNVETQKGVITHKGVFWFSNFLKRNIRKSFNLFNKSIPNIHLTKSKERFALIHCAHCLSKNEEEPWVLDLEGVWQLYVGGKTKKTKEKVKKILQRENCKKIMPWTKFTEKELLKEFPEMKSKIEVVYPAVPEQNFRKNKKKEVTLLFIARYFQWKGGFEAVEVIDNLTRNNKEVNAIIISDTPKGIIKKYYANQKIKFMDLIPQKRVFEEIYSASDILIYPGYSDSFGFAMLEAMSFGIPIITCEGYARKEIIEEGRTGFIAKGKSKEEEISEMVRLAGYLIKEKKKLTEMSNACLKTVKNGKFSIKERNKKLKKIYENAIK